MSKTSRTEPDLSVVIPAFNAGPWLPSTLAALSVATRNAGLAVEVVVVDDGSTDDTAVLLQSEKDAFPGELEVLSQTNSGRFAARLAGLKYARASRVLLLDARVLIDPNALAYAFAHTTPHGPRAWNAHIVTDESAPLVGRFWDVPTSIFWGSYLRHPRPYDLTAGNFDSAPKGTTMFLADRNMLLEAFDHADVDPSTKLVSDDTAVLRTLVRRVSIRLDPGFSATYRPRTTPRAFMSHSFDRGTLFVDSYGGTTPVRSAAILCAVVAPFTLVAGVVSALLSGRWGAALGAVGAAVSIALAPLVPAARNRTPRRSLLAYIVALPLFVAPFWAGLLRGVLVHRRVFRGRATRGQEKETQ